MSSINRLNLEFSNLANKNLLSRIFTTSKEEKFTVEIIAVLSKNILKSFKNNPKNEKIDLEQLILLKSRMTEFRVALNM